MIVPGSANPLLMADNCRSYLINRSLRFQSANSAYITRTPGVAGNRKKWTWAGWMKRASTGVAYQAIFGAWASNNEYRCALDFNASNQLVYFEWSTAMTTNKISTQTFTDTTSWIHVVMAFDSALSTASDRVKMYVNGVRITAFSTSQDPALNADSFVNSAIPHRHGIDYPGFGYLNASLADVHFVDGQALTPTDFGYECPPGSAIWRPKSYSGTYGTNGFRLDFADPTSVTTLGYDRSGNANNWTLNAMTTADSLVNTPTSS